MNSDLITNEVPLLTAGESLYLNSAKLRRKYQFTSRYDDQVFLYREDGEHLWLPRGLCPISPQDQRTDGDTAHFPKCPTPKANQVELFKIAEDTIAQGLSGVFVAPTGWGKTVLGYWMAYKVQRKTLVVTTKSDIYEQWLAGAQTLLGLTPDKIGEIRQDKCEVVGRDFVVALVQSLSKEGKYPDWVMEKFGLIIFDECHRMAADQFNKVVPKYPARFRFGVSATPSRKDGKEDLFYAHIGPIRGKAPETLMIPKVMRFKSEWKCPRTVVMQKDGSKKVERIHHEAGQMGHIDKILAVDPDRNALIAKAILAARSRGRSVVVFSTQHMHLTEIERSLKKEKVPSKDIGWYVSASTKKEKQEQQQAVTRPIILTVYQMMGEGTSIDWIDTALFAMPRSDVVQPAGRVRREYEDKRFPLLLDIVDNDSPVYRAYAANRLKWYNEIGCEVEDMF